MRELTIAGPRTGRPYPAVDTGERWNGAPVIAFRLADLVRLIEACDGLDANGEGLVILTGAPYDLTDGFAEPVEAVVIEDDGRPLALYAPAGRIWDETTPNSTVNPVRGTDSARAAGSGEPHAAARRACRPAALDAWRPAAAEPVGGYLAGEADGERDPIAPVNPVGVNRVNRGTARGSAGVPAAGAWPRFSFNEPLAHS